MIGTLAMTAAALALAGTGASDPAADRPVPREDCSTRSQAGFPGAFTDPDNLAVGPLVLMNAGGTPGFSEEFDGQKFPLLVRNGHRVILELPRRTARGARLAYGPLPRGEIAVGEAHRVVKFVACRRGESSGSSADGEPVTFWSGGVLAYSPRCVPLRVFVDGADDPRRAVIRLGVESCR